MKRKNEINWGLILGIAGAIAGIFLIVQEKYAIGISGGVASVGLIYISYTKSKTS